MKILRVIPSMNPKNGGPCQGIRNIIPPLTQLGIINEVVCLDKENSDFLTLDKFKIYAIGPSRTAWGYCSTLSIWLEENIKNYDVLVIHGLWLYHSFASVRALFRQRANSVAPKVYIMPHGMLDPWFQRDSTRKLKAIRNEIYWRLIEKWVVNSADGLLFTCEQELLLARETFKGYYPKKELNVGYGIQAPPKYIESMRSAFHIKTPNLGDKPYLLFLSRIHPKKGIDILINAYLNLEKSKAPLPDLVIAGPIEGEYAKNMQMIARFSKKIHFSGMLQGDSKWGAFYGCEAYILPSHQENFGISVAEALACGKPVLISDQVNICQEILSEHAGFVNVDTLSGVESSIQQWLGLTEGERKQMGVNAVTCFEKNFSVRVTANRLAETLRSDLI